MFYTRTPSDDVVSIMNKNVFNVQHPITKVRSAGYLKENAFGIKPNNYSGADFNNIELKTTDNKSMITLFHCGSTEQMIRIFGYPDASNPKNRRIGTVVRSGKINNRGFYLDNMEVKWNRDFCLTSNKASRAKGSPLSIRDWALQVDASDFYLKYEMDDLEAGFQKIDNLLLTQYRKSKETFSFTKSTYYSGISRKKAVAALQSGMIKIDFGSSDSHDHGAKFRISPKDIGHLYDFAPTEILPLQNIAKS